MHSIKRIIVPMEKRTLAHFRLAFISTIVGLLGAFILGLFNEDGGFKAVFLCAVLSILEISLSFDNAVVNASVLSRMTPIWRQRFLTWGVLIAVFGMRLLFPLVIVAVVGGLGPLEALKLASTRPDDYAGIMKEAHVPVAAFGGAFLTMVALRHLFTKQKHYWIQPIEKRLAKLSALPMADVVVTLAVVGGVALFSEAQFLYAGLLGLITFIVVDGLSSLLGGGHRHEKKIDDVHLSRASAGLFVYLEVLDASFSFDGVIGAFAVTTRLFLITIGLGIGAFYVRSLTMLLVEKGTLEHFKYLEQGAFWAIGALAAIMFISVFVPVPEILTGTIGAGFIGAALYSSIKSAKRPPHRPTAASL